MEDRRDRFAELSEPYEDYDDSHREKPDRLEEESSESEESAVDQSDPDYEPDLDEEDTEEPKLIIRRDTVQKIQRRDTQKQQDTWRALFDTAKKVRGKIRWKGFLQYINGTPSGNGIATFDSTSTAEKIGSEVLSKTLKLILASILVPKEEKKQTLPSILKDLKIDVNQQDQYGRTPLMYAFMIFVGNKGDYNTFIRPVIEFLAINSNMNIQDKDDNTPLSFAFPGNGFRSIWLSKGTVKKSTEEKIRGETILWLVDQGVDLLGREKTDDDLCYKTTPLVKALKSLDTQSTPSAIFSDIFNKILGRDEQSQSNLDRILNEKYENGYTLLEMLINAKRPDTTSAIAGILRVAVGGKKWTKASTICQKVKEHDETLLLSVLREPYFVRNCKIIMEKVLTIDIKGKERESLDYRRGRRRKRQPSQPISETRSLGFQNRSLQSTTVPNASNPALSLVSMAGNRHTSLGVQTDPAVEPAVLDFTTAGPIAPANAGIMFGGQAQDPFVWQPVSPLPPQLPPQPYQTGTTSLGDARLFDSYIPTGIVGYPQQATGPAAEPAVIPPDFVPAGPAVPNSRATAMSRGPQLMQFKRPSPIGNATAVVRREQMIENIEIQKRNLQRYAEQMERARTELERMEKEKRALETQMLREGSDLYYMPQGRGVFRR